MRQRRFSLRAMVRQRSVVRIIKLLFYLRGFLYFLCSRVCDSVYLVCIVLSTLEVDHFECTSKPTAHSPSDSFLCVVTLPNS